MKLTEEFIAKARPLFEQEGLSVRAAAKQLGVSWGTAKVLRDKICGAGEEEAGPEQPPDESDAWDIPLRIPAARAVDLFASFDLQEKMDAIAFVLQARMDAVLAPAEGEEG